MIWQKLLKFEQKEIGRGAVFRYRGVYPHETFVDFRVVENKEPSSGLALMVSSGYKAGLILTQLPVEARSSSGFQVVSVSWLKKHWTSRIYDTDVDSVFLTLGYEIADDWIGEH